MRNYFGLIVLLFLGVSSCSEKDKRAHNIQVFATIYGYVKYFHPSDEAHQMDWDTFAIYGAEKILACESEKELEETLEVLFKPIAPTLQLSNSKIQAESVLSKATPKNSKHFQNISGITKGSVLGCKTRIKFMKVKELKF